MMTQTEVQLVDLFLEDPDLLRVVWNGLRADDFATPEGSLVYKVMCRLRCEGKDVTFTNVADAVDDRALEEQGGRRVNLGPVLGLNA